MQNIIRTFPHTVQTNMSNVKFTHKKQVPMKRSYQLKIHSQISQPSASMQPQPSKLTLLKKAKVSEKNINTWFQRDCKIKILKKNFFFEKFKIISGGEINLGAGREE